MKSLKFRSTLAYQDCQDYSFVCVLEPHLFKGMLQYLFVLYPVVLLVNLMRGVTLHV
jgi:hypothetical protein